MANVLSVQELRGRSGGDDDQGSQTAERRFLVKCDSAFIDYLTILADARIPQRFSVYVNPVTGVINLAMVCRRRNARQNERKPEWWEVICEYSTQTANPGEGGETQIIGTTPKVSYQTWSFTEAFTKDRAGNAVVNSATDPFDPPPERARKENQFTVTAWFAQYNSLFYRSFINAINEHAWLGGRFAAKTLRVEDISAEPQFQFNTEFYEVVFILQEKSDTWTRKILDQGYRKKVSNQLINITDKHGRDVTSPVLLNGSGAPATLPSTGVFLSFEEFAEKDFGDLGINNAPIV
jgi:hypothetical protein